MSGIAVAGENGPELLVFDGADKRRREAGFLSSGEASSCRWSTGHEDPWHSGFGAEADQIHGAYPGIGGRQVKF